MNSYRIYVQDVGGIPPGPLRTRVIRELQAGVVLVDTGLFVGGDTAELAIATAWAVDGFHYPIVEQVKETS